MGRYKPNKPLFMPPLRSELKRASLLTSEDALCLHPLPPRTEKSLQGRCLESLENSRAFVLVFLVSLQTPDDNDVMSLRNAPVPESVTSFHKQQGGVATYCSKVAGR